MPAKAYALHIGVSTVDQEHYMHLLSELPCCIDDAKKMHGISKALKYNRKKLLLDDKATVPNVIKTLRQYQGLAEPGDLVVITYSGHGSYVEDLDGDEESGFDQTWCLFDRQLIDDELRVEWKKFKKGVNVFVMLDSCHSGSAVKAAEDKFNENLDNEITEFYESNYYLSKAIDFQKSAAIYNHNAALYEEIANNTPYVPIKEIKAAVLLISACQDNQEARAGFSLSYFTRLMLNILSDDFKAKKIGNYVNFHDKLVSKSIATQTPNYLFVNKGSNYFKTTKPFLLSAGDEYPKGFDKVVGTRISSKKPTGIELSAGLVLEIEDKDLKAVKKILDKDKLTQISPSKKSLEKTTDLLYSQPKMKGNAKGWDRAYALYEEIAKHGKYVLIEPDFDLDKDNKLVKYMKSVSGNNYTKSWPRPKSNKNEFIWHLLPEFTQLQEARDEVMKLPAKDRKIRIGHFDTGYIPSHPVFKDLKTHKPKSFVPGYWEKTNPAIDQINTRSIGEEDYHGTGTLALLGGGMVDKTMSYGGYEGLFGAIPFAEFVPIRIAETVALTGLLNNAQRFTRALYYAIEQKCEVISMSMAGAPARSWAKAINAAYEAGIVLVTAGGNSWRKGGRRVFPKKLMYPARYDRVLAATGVSYNGEPYNFEANSFCHNNLHRGEYQQGNHGPASAMETAMAAYSPNIAWATDDPHLPYRFRKNGGGTSSATTQIAAAAALWIVKNRAALQQYEGTWKKVEAVRHALKASANRDYVLSDKYYGWGTLKAMDALKKEVPDSSKLKRSKKVKISFWAISEFAKMVFLRKSGKTKKDSGPYEQKLSEMMELEIVQVMYKDQSLSEYVNSFGADDSKQIKNKAQFTSLFKKVQASPFASKFLKSL